MSRIVILYLSLTLAACSQPDDSVPVADEPRDIDAFFNDVFERELALSPIRQSYLGRQSDRLGEWDDFADERTYERVERGREDLQRLRNDFDYAALTEQQQLSYDLFVFDTERDIRNLEFHRHHYVVDQFNGQLSGLLAVLQNNHPVKSVQDAENYIARIEGLQTVLQQFAVDLRDRADFGVIAPAFSFPAVIADATSMSSGAPIEDTSEDNALFVDFRNKVAALELEDDEADDLLQRASAALRGPFADGFRELIAEVARLQDAQGDNHGVWSLPDGDAFYQNRIFHHTTLELSADEIHRTGLSEVERIQDEMRAIMREVGFDGSLREFFDAIREDPNNYFDNSDEGRQQFLAEAEAQIAEIYEIVGDYFHEVPKAELEVRRVEPWRENSTSIAFYNRPSEDGSRPGIYYANLADMSSVQRYVFAAITYHESAPGHHFQLALAQELQDLPTFRKFTHYGAFVEGWALYAEQLAREMGFYENPYHNFGRLQNELWRAVRLVLDTGMHAKRWTREQCIDYFRENTPLSEGDIVTEVERFFVNPGQALGYKLGMIKILELREQARDALGERFDIRDFHDAVIGSGSIPLGILEQRVARYIESASAD